MEELKAPPVQIFVTPLGLSPLSYKWSGFVPECLSAFNTL